jgi:hypothetical protein
MVVTQSVSVGTVVADGRTDRVAKQSEPLLVGERVRLLHNSLPEFFSRHILFSNGVI